MATEPKGEYIWLANGIGLTEVVGERALGLPPLADPLTATDADMPAAAQYGDQLLPLLQKKRDDLNNLALPPEDADQVMLTESLRHFAIKVAQFEKANEAAHQNDSAGFRHHWLKGRQHALAADAFFIQYGLTLCAAD